MPDPVVFGDLDSPTIRVRFFGGRSVQVVADEMPILPVTAPGLPPPGPSFVDFARTLGDPDPVRPKRGRAAPPSGPHLHALVRSAVYQTGTRVQVEFNGQVDAYEYQAGVLCDGDPRGDGYGPGRCRLVVVGKCLGPNEVRDGRPFTGPRSRDLWRAWDEAELPRPGAALPTFLTNLLRFAPPQAVVQSRLPSAWVADGLHLLRQELVRCRPEVVLVFGADALKALMGNKAKVGEYAGRSVPLVLDCRPTADHPPDDHHTRVVAVEHPASIVRDPDRYPQFLSGIKYAARLLGFGPAAAAAAVPLDYRPVYTTAELATAVAESERASAGGGYVSFDCEWEGRHPGEPGAYLYTVQWSHAPGHARVCFVRRQGGAPNPALPPDQAAPLLRRLFEAAPRRGARLVGHFAKADLPWLHSIGVDLYDHYVGPDDDPDPDGVDRLFGWQKTYFEGAFDTYVSQHAIDETAALKLEVMAATVLGVDRWDSAVIDWRAEYCKARGIRQSELAGYGNMTEEMVTRYGSCDVDFPGRLYLKFNGDPRTGTTGMLDADRFGQSSRQIFGHRMRAWAAWAEMERYGLLVDKDVHRDLRESLLARREELFAQFRAEVNWPDFDPAKTRHKVEFLFGEAFSPDQKPLRPPGALSLYLTPYKATKTFGGGRLWDDALYRAATHGDPDPVPAADKETLIILSRQHQLVAMLKDVETLRTALKLTFRPPVAPDEPAAGGDDDDDDFAAGLIDPDPVVEPDERYDKGLLAHLGADGRIRPMLRLVETGRLSSSPNLQNCFHPAVQFLTRRGWVRGPELLDTDFVAQFDPTTESVSFVRPTRVIRQPYAGDLVCLETDEQIRLTMTPDHRCLVRQRRGSRSWETVAAVDVPEDRLYYHAGVFAGGARSLSADEVVLLCAAQADGSWTESGAMVFRFRKVRKITRLRTTLSRLGVAYTEGVESRGVVRFHVGRPLCGPTLAWLDATIGREKRWGPWLFDFDRGTLDAIVSELPLWDGLATRGTEYYSSDEVNADWVQALFALSGLRASHGLYDNGLSTSRICHVIRTPGRRVPYSMTTNRRITTVPYVGDVHCVTVPTGYIVVREAGRVSVSGNCASSVDDTLNRILGWGAHAKDGTPERDREFVSRSIFKAQPGWLLVGADLKGAEIAMAGWYSGDPLLIDHARRSTLKKSDPDWIDLHSDLAARAFHLTCALKDVPKPQRTAAKRARFGHYYGASPETIHRKALEEDPTVTLEDVREIVAGHDKAYPTLAKFFAACRGRVSKPGWLCNGFGGRRRFRPVGDRDLLAKQEREAQNWSCQGGVADHMTVATGHARAELRRRGMRTRIVLSVHDSLLLEAPVAEVDWAVEVLHAAMVDLTPVVVTALDGTPVEGRGPYRFGIDVEVCRHWGVPIPEAEWRAAARAARGE